MTYIVLCLDEMYDEVTDTAFNEVKAILDNGELIDTVKNL